MKEHWMVYVAWQGSREYESRPREEDMHKWAGTSWKEVERLAIHKSLRERGGITTPCRCRVFSYPCKANRDNGWMLVGEFLLEPKHEHVRR